MTRKVVQLDSEFCKNKKLDHNRYKPIEIIGQGAYGIVMKCQDKQTNETVAIKKIIDSCFKMPKVLRELTILKKLNKHMHVISFLDIFRTKGFIYIVFPHMDYDMYEYISEYYPNGLGYNLTKKYMIQIIKGIDYIHGNYIVHRDIKPENILLTINGMVKICDMGVSKMICSPFFNADLEMTPEMGTLWYMAPEMLLGIQKYGTEVDIWSLGIVFVECMSGQPIITKNTSLRQYQSIIKYFGVTISDQKYLNGIIMNLNNTFSIKYINTKRYSSVHKALKNYYPQWPIDLIEIVSKCLEFNPSKRKTAKLLLNESYFEF